MKSKKAMYFLLVIFFALGYLFGFSLIGVITYPLVIFNEKRLEYAMKNGMVCGFLAGLLCHIILLL